VLFAEKCIKIMFLFFKIQFDINTSKRFENTKKEAKNNLNFSKPISGPHFQTGAKHNTLAFVVHVCFQVGEIIFFYLFNV
jgi:hypothetical protein